MRQYIIITGLLLSGCVSQTTGPSSTSGAEVEESAPVVVERSTSAATNSLLAAADDASQRADHGNAIAYLERAVRIEPRNAELWIKLAGQHLANQDFTAATQHCRKAIALAEQDVGLTRRAWLLMADIKQAQGNTAEADAIRRQYQTVPT